MIYFIVNLVIAAAWMLLLPTRSAGGFLVGFVVGFLAIAICGPVIGGRDYVRRVAAFLRFLLVFLKEFLLANWAVAMTVLFGRRESLHPNFITMDVTGMKPFEILILSYCITLTPGTTSVDIEDDFKVLIIHALDAEKPDVVRNDINRSLRAAILRFTR